MRNKSGIGGVNEGETLEQAAQRELAEEAGFKAGRLIHKEVIMFRHCLCFNTMTGLVAFTHWV